MKPNTTQPKQKKSRLMKKVGTLFGKDVYSLEKMPKGWIAGVGKDGKAIYVDLTEYLK